ncbi:Wzz/FepE/Etk N-terminal domain-containing protein [Roseivirga pacifica]|uniref:Wzz/FepE/Etk N-terminal domain-containing protein n=1 Tax=Roseivirga pacifica TaxID=1267423 RepID=UPI003BA8EB70
MNSRIEMQVDEIHILSWLKVLYANRRVLIAFIFIFFLLSVLIALLTPKVYTVSTKMVANSSEGGLSIGGGLSGFASLAGIELPQSSGGQGQISPVLYPRIVESIPFRMKLIDFPMFDSGRKVITYKDYIENIKRNTPLETIVGLPSTIISLISNETDNPPVEQRLIETDTISKVSRDDLKYLSTLSEEITLSVGKKDGVITLEVSMQSPELAAQLAFRAQRILKEQITDFKIAQAKERLKFTQELYDEKESDFLKSQNALSIFLDRNQNISTSLGRNELNILESKYNIASSVFLEVSKQLENAKIKVKEETPSFTVLQPIFVPIEPSGPSRVIIVVGATIFGGLLGLVYIFLKMLYESSRMNLSALNGAESDPDKVNT